MSGTNQDKASNVDRRTSIRTSTRTSTRFSIAHDHDRDIDHDADYNDNGNDNENDSDDDDSYALAAMGISDGFRPPDVAENHAYNAPAPLDYEPPTFRSPPRPSSVTKGNRRRESLSLRHDGDQQPPVHVASDNTPSRMASVSETTRFSTADSIGDETLPGPSHPYDMYPQNVRLARTASLATTSTVPISERSYAGPRGPTHPYGMYPQTMVPEEEGRTEQNAIPVGFPGTVDNYQRRLGPEGEDAADLIGPDGHMEQLPPYTRYPEEAYHRKALGIPPPQPAPAETMQSTPGEGSIPAGAGGLGLATRDPEYASTDNLAVANSPLSRQSVRSFTSEASHHDINTAALSVVNEKEKPSNWKTAARKRVWGVVPCWAIALAVLVLVLMGVVVGAVLGTILGARLRKTPPPDKTSTAAVTFTYDYQPISTLPPDLPDLAEGTYDMPLMLQRSPDTCFDDTTQAGSWNCNILFADLSLNVSPRPGEPDTSSYSFEFQYDDSRTLDAGVYSYGMQPPSSSSPLRLRLVEDSLEPDRGPAWSFQTLYNKTVIVPEEYLTADNPIASGSPDSSTTSKKKFRRNEFMFGDGVHRKGVAKPGDKPWVCYWESTLLETFIYATQNNSFERVNTASGSSSSSYPSPSTPTLSPTDVVDKRRLSQPRDKLHDFPPPPHFEEELGPWTSAPYSVPPTMTSSSAATSTSDVFDSWPTPSKSSQVYPRVIKVMERRIPGFASVDPWCRQFQILDDGTVAPLTDQNGHEVHVNIKETEDDEDLNSEYSDTGSNSSDNMSDCGCLWWLT